MTSPEQIWVIIPAYNEGPVIEQVVSKVIATGFPHVLVIDDGSKDDTARQARNAGARVLSHPINRGAGAAAQTGLAYARRRGWPYVVQIDADGQHHPEDIHRLVAAQVKTDADIVLGSRFLSPSPGIPPTRIFYNRISNILTNTFCKRSYSDTQTGFRMLNHRAIRNLRLRLDGFGYCSEMIVQAEEKGLIIAEAPIQVTYTDYSLNKGQDLLMGITTAIDLLWKLLFYPSKMK
ncbi:MAG: glycosyltransferase family 2 protein [Phaeodactylibacter sp.]|uniref:glycosyltransferase family 2 protein n=1 Tax=Phaeodactylibacter sp. TaxID=1940289 RepID=UPI0032EFD477